MSILIKGMEMPTSCRECRLKMNCDDCEGWECVCVPLQQQIGYLDDLLSDKRREDCPLVPVPPHGRLIDADALMEHCVDLPREGGYLPIVYKSYITNAPTIIPAELQKENEQ